MSESKQSEKVERIKTSITVPKHQYEEWDEEREEIEESRGNNTYSLSAYIRDRVQAGRVQLESLTDQNQNGLQRKVLQQLPDDPSDAVDGEEVVEKILEEDREAIWEILDTSNSIGTSRGRYYKE